MSDQRPPFNWSAFLMVSILALGVWMFLRPTENPIQFLFRLAVFCLLAGSLAVALFFRKPPMPPTRE